MGAQRPHDRRQLVLRGERLAAVAAQISTGRLPVERVVTERTTMSEASSAFARLASGTADDLKVLISTANGGAHG